MASSREHYRHKRARIINYLGGQCVCTSPACANHEGRRCGSTLDLHIDHIVPCLEGRTDDRRRNSWGNRDNLQLLCRPCHLVKTTEENRARTGFPYARTRDIQDSRTVSAHATTIEERYERWKREQQLAKERQNSVQLSGETKEALQTPSVQDHPEMVRLKEDYERWKREHPPVKESQNSAQPSGETKEAPQTPAVQDPASSLSRDEGLLASRRTRRRILLAHKIRGGNSRSH